eukprot:TRINITY_DN8774_c0_g1_i8.p2 TRINITY_DN8774_c0_g1~~TRINITY_DN8774_c0_g1_i8.p2  ORF type:complete len:155 (-),score=3.00 TRINITY_DN8774_c0_g1_i8:351-815(-)
MCIRDRRKTGLLRLANFTDKQPKNHQEENSNQQIQEQLVKELPPRNLIQHCANISSILFSSPHIVVGVQQIPRLLIHSRSGFLRYVACILPHSNHLIEFFCLLSRLLQILSVLRISLIIKLLLLLTPHTTVLLTGLLYSSLRLRRSLSTSLCWK